MDIKTLLLKGLSSQKPIRACHRLLIENKGYVTNIIDIGLNNFITLR